MKKIGIYRGFEIRADTSRLILTRPDYPWEIALEPEGFVPPLALGRAMVDAIVDLERKPKSPEELLGAIRCMEVTLTKSDTAEMERRVAASSSAPREPRGESRL